MSKVKLEIKNRWTGNVLFEYEKENNTLKDTMEKAVEEGADLEGADLKGADLKGADLKGADLKGADLKGADLEGADLEGADLKGADLEGADLKGADLEGADLKGADLKGADLKGAYIYVDDNDIDVQEKVANFEKNTNLKITETYINHDVIPTRWSCFWKNGLIIRQYEVVEKRESKFKVGDKVIGNDKADFNYGITQKGYIGTVTSITNSEIKLNGLYWVDPDCFDKLEVKEMTVAEISKALGYEVKIVKEEK